MRTEFTAEQLADPGVAACNDILRACVHCGFCTATCPTYQLLGDERDSPRGRIYLIKEMLESGRDADAETVTHIDRCLSCLACMTTCPSGVHYMHLVDHARVHIEKTHRRPLLDRGLRWLLARLIPNPALFRLSLMGAKLGKPFAPLFTGRMRAMLELAPDRIAPPSRLDDPQSHPAKGARRMRVALMTGCAQRALDDAINAATIRLLTRLGADVVIAEGAGCCGAVTHHMGQEKPAHDAAARNIRAWTTEIEGEGLDAIVINASGCGTTVKDYGWMFRNDPLAEQAAQVSALTRDVSEVLLDLLPENPLPPRSLRVAYHAACSLQHGQKITEAPKAVLRRAGFVPLEPAEPHLCCGSAGVYNILQPEIAGKLGARKGGNLAATGADLVVAGNIGCISQIKQNLDIPVMHLVELIDNSYSNGDIENEFDLCSKS